MQKQTYLCKLKQAVNKIKHFQRIISALNFKFSLSLIYCHFIIGDGFLTFMPNSYFNLTMKIQLLALAAALLFASTTFAKTIHGLANDFKQQKSTGISFTENKGQVHDQDYKPRPDVLYGAMTGNMALHIKTNGVSYQLYRADTYKKVEDPKTKQKRDVIDQQSIYRIDLNWINYNTNFTQTGDEILQSYSNYYLENCPNGALHVKSYRGVILNNLYNGINLHYYEKNGQLKHDYIVAPGADYKQIQLQVNGASISVNRDGSLLLTTPLGKVQEGAPIVYQNRKQLKARWHIKNNTLSFAVENYDPNYELIIDPVTRLWGTYYGSTGDDESYSGAADASGNVYLAGYTGSTTSTLIATVGSYQSTYAFGANDAFLAKFDSYGTLLWGTYYGGAGYDAAYGCITDLSGNVYMTGNTSSSTGTVMATVGSHQPTFASGSSGGDAFLVKFDGTGARLWGTYYGGTGDDQGWSCATDASGNVYMSGYTKSNSGIATAGSQQPSYSSGKDAFLVKFNSSGSRQWGTYYGGAGDDYGYTCAVDVSGNVCLAGLTNSGNGIATIGCHQPAFASGQTGFTSDGFLVKFNSSGTRQWGTYYGGSGYELRTSCAVDVSGNVYLAGETASNTGTVIATVGSHQPLMGGNSDAFLVKFDASGTRQWATYYGGTGGDGGYCATDASGNVYLAGITSSNTGTAVATLGSHQTVNAGGSCDAFLAKFDAAGIRQWGTYYGGPGLDQLECCAVDAFGHVYLPGQTTSNTGTSIATANSNQTTYGGSVDAFLVKFDVCDVAPAQPLAISGPTVVCAAAIATYGTPLAFGANAYTLSLPGGGTSASTTNSISVTPVSTGIFTLVAGNACGVSPQQTLNVTVKATPTIVVNNGAICAGQSFTLTATGATTYTYSSGPTVTPSLTSSYTVAGTNTVGCSNSAVTSVTVNSLPLITVNSGAICAGSSFVIMPGGASTYTVSGGSFTVSPSVQTSYSVTGTSAQGCASSNTAVATAVVNPLPIVNVNSGAICAGSNFMIIPGGAITYTVTGGSFTVSPGTQTAYSVTGTSAAGCVSSNTAVSSVTVNPLPNVGVSTSNPFVCAGESVTLTASGASTYTFNPGSAGATNTIAPIITTTYAITGTGTNGCSATALITQNVDACTAINTNGMANSGIKLYPNPTREIFNLELDSDNDVTIINATGQLVYSSKLSAGNHQINLNDLAVGIYIVKVGNAASSKQLKFIKE